MKVVLLSVSVLAVSLVVVIHGATLDEETIRCLQENALLISSPFGFNQCVFEDITIDLLVCISLC